MLHPYPVPDNMRTPPTNYKVVLWLKNLEDIIRHFTDEELPNIGKHSMLNGSSGDNILSSHEKRCRVGNLHIDPTSVEEDNFDMSNLSEEDRRIEEETRVIASKIMCSDVFLQEDDDKDTQNVRDMIGALYLKQVEYNIQQVRKMTARGRIEKSSCHGDKPILREIHLKHLEREAREVRNQILERRTDNYPRYEKYA